jgi:dTDP-4-amino-4,6-dideoxygalactose transaminase
LHAEDDLKVPMNDLKRQFQALRGEMEPAIAAVLESQLFILGKPVAELEARVAARVGVKHAVGCASGSDALLLALRAHDIGPGDEVITTPFTFFATGGAISRLGARPVYVDIDPRTFNIDPAAVRAALTPRTKAILPVHLYGRVADMDALLSIASDAGGIPVIEDAAQALGAADARGRPACSIGRVGCISFFPTKNLGAYGDAGMMTTDDDALAARLRRLRVHGSSATYVYAEVGVNSRLDALQAAVLLVKWPRLDAWNDARRRHGARYGERLAARAPEVVAPEVVDGHIVHCYTVRVPEGRRDALKKHLDERGIGSAVYYPLPLHLQDAWKDLGMKEGSLPHSERAAREVLSLPMFAEMRDEEIDAVVDGIASFYGR